MAAAAAVLLLALPTPASAGAIISNGDVSLGVTDSGTLGVCCGPPSATVHTATVALRDDGTGLEGIGPGCICEGWGVSGGGASGSRSAYAWPPASSLSFTSTPSTATSVDQVGDLRVTHAFRPSASPDLYEVQVTLQNTGPAPLSDVRYRRVADFDVEPTPFTELMTLDGTAIPGPLVESGDNGFCDPDPTVSCTAIMASGPPAGRFYTDAGPADHGALLGFGFGTLPAGGSLAFRLYYGVADSEPAALAALSTVGAEMWHLGQQKDGGATGAPATFVLAVGNMDDLAPPQCATPALQLPANLPYPGVRPCLPALPCPPVVAATPVGGLDAGQRDWAGQAGGPSAAVDACLPEPLCLKGGVRVALLGLRVDLDLRHLRLELGAGGGPPKAGLDPGKCL